MVTKRIIPCLDIASGRVVKGVKLTDLVDSGDPVELAQRYEQEGADELVLLDITATVENRGTFVDVVERVAEAIRIPFTVGGGVRTIEDVRTLLKAGADKVSFGTVAELDPKVVRTASEAFGKQAIVVSVDAKSVVSRESSVDRRWTVWTKGGREDSGVEVVEFCRRLEAFGAGELLVNSLDRDGTGTGFDVELLRRVTSAVSIPVIASSGAGRPEDFYDAFENGRVDAALAAGIFHRKELSVEQVKVFLTRQGVAVRPVALRPDFDKMGGLIPAVVQHRKTGAVLMLGFMDGEAFRRMVADRRVWFYSRTKKRLWMKGEESGNVLSVVDLKLDCDADSVLVLVDTVGPTCHTGEESCFGVSRGYHADLSQDTPSPQTADFRRSPQARSGGSRSSAPKFDGQVEFLTELFDLLHQRKTSGDSTSYTRRLLDSGLDKICAKVLEESVEVCRAARTEADERVVEESADVVYHLMVLLTARGVAWEEVVEELKRRRA